MATPTLAQQAAIANLYIALFNRAPDAAGFAFWTQALADGASIDVLARGFVQTPEAQAIYPVSQTAAQFVTTYYANVLGRPIDASGLAFWTGILESSGGVDSTFARALVVSKIVEVVNTPLPVKPDGLTDEAYALTFADRNAFKNKVDISIFYATDYKGNDLNLAKQVLSVVGPATTTIDVAKALLNPPTGGGGTPAPVPPVAQPGIEFTGTFGNDGFLGSSGDDTFIFVIDKVTPGRTTLSSNDKISGADGSDTLTVTTTGTVTNADLTFASMTSIENVIIKRTDASALTYDAVAGVQKITVEGGSGNVQLNNLADNSKFVLKDITGGNFTGLYANVSAADVTLSGVTGTYLTAATAGTSVTLTSTGGGGNTLTGYNMGGNVSTLKIVADAAFTTPYLNGGDNVKVEITGAARVDLGVLDRPSFREIDASANIGGLTATLATNNPVVKVTGSAGNDVISTGAAVLTSGFVDAGGGDGDRLIVTNTAALNSSALRLKYTGFEILQVENGVSVDLSDLVGITSVDINDGAGNLMISNLSAAQAGAITILSADPTGLLALAPASGVDTVKATVTTTAGAAGQAINLSGFAVTNEVTKLELIGNGAAGATAGLVTLTTANATTLTSIVVKNEGGAFITVGGGHTGTNLSIDASGSAGAVTINGSSYGTLTALTIKGGSGTNVLTGSTRGDTIVGGAGVDTINAGVTAVGSGVDILTGGTGADTFVFSVANNNTAHGGITAVITDFKGGEDKIQFTVATLASTAAIQKAGGVAADLVALLSAADAALNNTVRAYIGQVDESHTYVVADMDGNGYSEVIQLTGVSLADIGVGDFVLSGPPLPP